MRELDSALVTALASVARAEEAVGQVELDISLQLLNGGNPAAYEALLAIKNNELRLARARLSSAEDRYQEN